MFSIEILAFTILPSISSLFWLYSIIVCNVFFWTTKGKLKASGVAALTQVHNGFLHQFRHWTSKSISVLFYHLSRLTASTLWIESARRLCEAVEPAGKSHQSCGAFI